MLTRYMLAITAIPSICVPLAPAVAQTGDTAVDDSEIVVTARKRDETSIAVPVVLTAVSRAELDRRAINSIDAIARVVPQLISGESGGSAQSGNISIRGLSGADSNPFADQAVSFNIDGVQVAKSVVRRLAMMDLQQVEVLKGPQALFFGKNSPAGIISLKTADPTQSFDAKVSAGYEFHAQEWRGDGYISGPITDTLGGWLAFYGSHIRGWVKSEVPRTAPLAPEERIAPRQNEYAVRGTLKFEPSEAFHARAKLSYSKRTGSGPLANTQLVFCPLGTPQLGGVGDCEPNEKISQGVAGPNFVVIDPRFGNGVPFLTMKQMLGSLEANYDFSDDVTLTSVTGYYHLRTSQRDTFTGNYQPSSLLASASDYRVREISQEIRLRTNYSGPLNLMIGGYFQDASAMVSVVTGTNASAPVFRNRFLLKQKGRAWSAFGQALWNVVPTVEFAVGGRYSRETKRLPVVRAGLTLPRIPTPDTRGSWNDFSPEATLTWRPTTRLTVFGSYKHGFLSGGFNSGATNFAASLKFDQQTIKGFEGGVKALLLDGTLRVNLSTYDYRVKGLQVTTSINAVQTVTNAGKVGLRGAEFDFNFAPREIPGLSLRGSASYNRGRYLNYTVTCYRGQTQAQGCNFGPVSASGTYALQDLSGTELARAPKWIKSIGISYDTPIVGEHRLGLSFDASRTGSFLTDAASIPFARQKAYTLIDATARVTFAGERYEAALIGRNLTNEYYFTRGTGITGTGTPAGGVTGGPPDIYAPLSRGREVMLRFTAKLGK